MGKILSNIYSFFRNFFKRSGLSDDPKKEHSGITIREREEAEAKEEEKLNKFTENPILAPKGNNNWESWQTFNPGAIDIGDKVALLYRAIGEDGMSRLGYAETIDGFNVNQRLQQPVYEHDTGLQPFSLFSYFSGGSFGGAEDPRLTYIEEDDRIYMLYTAVHDGLRVAITSISREDLLKQKWNWSAPQLISLPGQVHKNWVLFPERINGKYAILHSIDPEVSIDYLDDLNFSGKNRFIRSFKGGSMRSNSWDKWLRGVGTPPIKTEKGWLVFYHAMDDDWGKYKVGAMLLDAENPEKVLRRSREPVLTASDLYYENNGFKGGVIYATGTAIRGDNLLLYYGAADSYTGVAYCNFSQLIEALTRDEKPRFAKKILKGSRAGL